MAMILFICLIVPAMIGLWCGLSLAATVVSVLYVIAVCGFVIGGGGVVALGMTKPSGYSGTAGGNLVLLCAFVALASLAFGLSVYLGTHIVIV